MVRRCLLKQNWTAGIAQRERAAAHEAGASPHAELSSRAQARSSAARPLPRRSTAEGYGRRLGRPAAPVAGVHRCATASGATPTTACPPPPARRGGRPQSAARSEPAVAAVRRVPHHTASPGRRLAHPRCHPPHRRAPAVTSCRTTRTAGDTAPAVRGSLRRARNCGRRPRATPPRPPLTLLEPPDATPTNPVAPKAVQQRPTGGRPRTASRHGRPPRAKPPPPHPHSLTPRKRSPRPQQQPAQRDGRSYPANGGRLAVAAAGTRGTPLCHRYAPPHPYNTRCPPTAVS